MLKARAGKILVIGLSEVNIERLREGKPVHFYTQEVGFVGGGVEQIFIFTGKDEQEMKRQFSELIGPDTDVKDTSRKPRPRH